MTQVIAAEGGYQAFTLSSTEWGWLIFAGAVAIVALLLGVVLMRGVLAKEQGTEKMQEIAGAIQEGALAYLKRQFRTIGMIVIPVAIVVFLTSTAINKEATLEGPGDQMLTFVQSGAFRTLAFVLGCVFSASIGFFGMWLAVRGNVRTAAAARRSDFNGALQVAFRTGGVAGLLTAGLGLLGTVGIVMIFQNTASAILVGFGFGGSLLALFLRVGGGIFTKAADVGADLVGKVEAGIPEDDPRNPATIADNVGDNVGDCAGMAADLFESFAVTLVASIILGVSAFKAIGLDESQAAKGVIFPIAVVAIGLLASMVGIFLVKGRPGETDALAAINRGIYAAQALAIVGAGAVAFLYVGNPTPKADAVATLSNPGARLFGAIVAGVVLGFAASKITQYYTSTTTKPVQDIAKAARTGPATTVLEGISSGLESAVWALVAIAVAIGVALMLGGGNIAFSLYLVALTGIGMLATTGIVVAEDTFGPVADNAAGIAEMAGEFEGEPERIMVSLDAVGNTTKAVTKGFAIGSAVIAAVALFASYSETIAKATLSVAEITKAELDGTLASLVQINVADPKTFIGLLIGGSVAFLFSSLAIRAVSRTAGTIVQEVRRQFREKPGIMDYTERPDYGPVIDICTTASLRELATPALLAVLTPVIIGFGLDYYALGAFLAAAIVTGQLMANFLSNAGGAWDNAKKYIEDGHEGGKGSETHKAAVIGDTVGDPFKDTAGPALNPLIKVMNLVALLVLPAIIELRDNNIRFAIAGAALVVVLGAITYSKKQGGGSMMDEAPVSTNA
jgi:K(+)-stimulated pyrophosphate-energized sodium pump